MNWYLPTQINNILYEKKNSSQPSACDLWKLVMEIIPIFYDNNHTEQNAKFLSKEVQGPKSNVV